MTHLLTRTSSVKADAQGNLPLTLSSLLPSAPITGHEIGVSGGAYAAALPTATFRARVGGGIATVESNNLIAVPLAGSSYPNFLEWGPERIATSPRMSNTVETGVSTLQNLYTSSGVFGGTRYYCGFRLSAAGTYRLSMDWCNGALTPSGGGIDVQWRTSTNQTLGPVVRMGRNDERTASCDGYVVVAGTTDVGTYVVATAGGRYNIANFVDICITVEKIA